MGGPVTILEQQVQEARDYLASADDEIARGERELERMRKNREVAASNLERFEVALDAVRGALGAAPEVGLQGDAIAARKQWIIPPPSRSADPVDDCAATGLTGQGRCIEPGTVGGFCELHARAAGGR